MNKEFPFWVKNGLIHNSVSQLSDQLGFTIAWSLKTPRQQQNPTGPRAWRAKLNMATWLMDELMDIIPKKLH